MRGDRRSASRLLACFVLAWLALVARGPVPLAGDSLGKASQSPIAAVGQDQPGLAAYPWLYLRGGAELAEAEQVVQVVAVGDLMLGRGVGGVAQPFSGVAPWLRSADLAMGNLECVVAQAGTARPGPYRLRAPLSSIAELHAAGFDLLGLANNHSLDFGPEGLSEMAARLQDAGIDFFGAGPDPAATILPSFRGIGGLRMAFLAFNMVPDPADAPGDAGWTRAAWDRETVLAAITAARAHAGAVIVSIHWGFEFDLRTDPSQRAIARAMLQAGADLVIGHHPHVVQGTEVIGDGFVAYSLGNFAFDQQQEGTRQGLALRAFFDEKGLRAVQALPVSAGPRPRWMAAGESPSLLARVQPPLKRTGYTCDYSDCQPVDVPMETASGSFRAGSIDLTGDGLPEQVQLLREQVAIYDDGAEKWISPPQWRVVDAALGDPNDDGRAELFLAFWRPDGPGLEGSHPFIVGYRRGAYRVIWGGSAVDHPILEVELGDVDGDGAQDLVVLSQRDEGRVVGVWHWNGWGFSEVWHSQPGRYRDLVLLAGARGASLTISVALEP